MRAPIPCALFLACLLAGSTDAAPIGSAFTFQARLSEDGQPASGQYDLEFELFDAEQGGSPIGLIPISGLIGTDGAVGEEGRIGREGLISVMLDFGDGAFVGDARWLEVRVRKQGESEFTTLQPRQPILSTPYALHAQFVGRGVVGSTEIDASQVQARVLSACAAGSSIRAIAQDGSVTCELDNSEASPWTTETDGSLFSGVNAVIGPMFSPDPALSLRQASNITRPQLLLQEETPNNFARLSFANLAQSTSYWTIAARNQSDGNADLMNFYLANANGGADILSLRGNRHVGINTTNPAAPLSVQARDNWRPGVGAGRGDFYVGDGQVGLSIGVSLGGGGRGVTRLWTNNSTPMYFGNENDVSMTVGASGDRVGIGTTDPQQRLDVQGGGVRIGTLGGGAANRAVLVEPDGDLVAGPAATGGPASLFGSFGGDGRDGAFNASGTTSLGSGSPSEVLVRQYTSFSLSGTLNIRAPFAYIAVSGRCEGLTAGSVINAREGALGGIQGDSGPGFPGSSGRLVTDQCVSGAGATGGSTAQDSGGAGGAAEGGSDGTNTLKRLLLSGGANPGADVQLRGFGSNVTRTDAFADLLRCVGGGGGAGAPSTGGALGGAGGRGGGVIYLECGELAGSLTVNASGNPAPSAGAGRDGGGGGGGVALIRARSAQGTAQWGARAEGGLSTEGGDGQHGYADIVVFEE
ncbi:hypothetical protein [Pseudomarimonas salicorniae]|uniref:Uncharacterized protein n=1 Tax=Pseudomarimonas salicorniae TaxID=2933270 RepID=A0ABT0GFH5_9GAMM|nr:hypothetical protein [Lysobacter sp. CAU 1642]MCK7592934.1 hypothetical protein [Lysobacter sp. CAU 1642]